VVALKRPKKASNSTFTNSLGETFDPQPTVFTFVVPDNPPKGDTFASSGTATASALSDFTP